MGSFGSVLGTRLTNPPALQLGLLLFRSLQSAWWSGGPGEATAQEGGGRPSSLGGGQRGGVGEGQTPMANVSSVRCKRALTEPNKTNKAWIPVAQAKHGL